MRVLVAEDDPGLREVLVLAPGQRYQVDAVDRGDDAIDQLKWYDYDVAVIDWRMPGAEGIDVVAWAGARRPTALLMLTARDAPADRIRGLDTGADDYLVKPFDFGELLARIRALQRRPRGVDEPVIERAESRSIPSGASRDGRRAIAGPDRHRIPDPRTADAPLARRRRPKAIAEHAWADETDPLGSNAIDVQLSRLRAKMPDAGIRIVTVRGAGYGSRKHDRQAARTASGGSRSGSPWRPPCVVAVVYFVVAVAVVASSTRNLTAQIDERLARRSSVAHDAASPTDGGRTSSRRRDGGTGATTRGLLVWIDRTPDGDGRAGLDDAATCPPSSSRVTAPARR